MNKAKAKARAKGYRVRVSTWVFAAGAMLLSSSSYSANEEPAQPDVVTSTVEIGAGVFASRCTLCHGNVGMGEGIMATALKGYPATNLRKNKYGIDKESLKQAVIYGGQRGAMHNAMPPFGDELTWVETESIVKYMSLYYSDIDRAVELLKTTKVVIPVKRELGRIIFQRRCTICHGKNGDGQGKMARIIKDPPPFNLTLSAAPDDYLLKMITNGGEKMGRSPRMPPFGSELSEADVRSIILYIKGFRIN